MFRRIILFAFGAVAAVYLFWTVALFALRTVNPPTTGVQMQRRVEAWVHGTRYRKRYTFVPLSKISPELQHAVISAEDGRFYQHHGIDWDETEKVAAGEPGKRRAGTRRVDHYAAVSQESCSSPRIAIPCARLFEYTLAPMADWILGKRRVLELYLNVVEWGPSGVYGIEEGAKYHYHVRRRVWIARNPHGWPRFCRRRGGGVRHAWTITARSFWLVWKRRAGKAPLGESHPAVRHDPRPAPKPCV